MAEQKRDSPKACWDYTLHFPEAIRKVDDPLENKDCLALIDLMQRYFKESAPTYDKWVFQLERGEQSGSLHFQGRFHLKTKKRKQTLIAEWSASNPFLGRASFSLTHDVGSFRYVMKEETRVSGPYSNQFRKYAWMTQIWENPRPFQRDLTERLPFDRRRIHFVHNPDGGAGKTMWSLTQLAASAQCWPGATLTVYMPEWQTYKDLRRGVHGQLKKMDPERYVDGVQMLIDLPRIKPAPNALAQIIGTLELLKNGWIEEDRYSNTYIQLDTTKVIVFHNWQLPDYPEFWDLLSADRWCRWYISQEHELVKTWPLAAPQDDI